MSSEDASAQDGALADTLTEPGSLERPLCVELEGALLAGDDLWEALNPLIRRRPWLLLWTPFWMLLGRERLRRRLMDQSDLYVQGLPYRRGVLEALRVTRAKGRKLVLVSALGNGLAERIQSHLGIFEEVVTDGRATRSATLAARFPGGFDYMTSSSADRAVLDAARQGYVVGGTPSANEKLSSVPNVRTFLPKRSVARALVKELRPHQWVKNALLLLPVMLAPGIPDAPKVLQAILAAVTFSFCASAGYVLNDWLDLEADRAHRTKCRRPFASGDLPLVAGPPLFFGLLVVSFTLAIGFLSPRFGALLFLYLIGTISYSLYFKRLLLVDVLMLAGLYTHRILAGGVAASTQVSAWLLGFSMFFFTSLAFVKRYIELRPMEAADRVQNRGYFKTDLAMVTAMGTASAYIAALVFVLYVDSVSVRATYREPSLLWLILPILLYWLGRVWLLAGRGQMQDDPVKFAVKDSRSLICGAAIAGLVLVARFTPEPLARIVTWGP